MVWWHFVIIIVVSYFIGNISFSRMFGKIKHQDITKLGSGNAGSTNVLRNFGFKFGVLNLILDILKGFAPACFFYYIFAEAVRKYAVNGDIICFFISAEWMLLK